MGTKKALFSSSGEKRKKRKALIYLALRFFNFRAGAGVQIRTGDLRITSALLYQLSYTGIEMAVPLRFELRCSP